MSDESPAVLTERKQRLLARKEEIDAQIAAARAEMTAITERARSQKRYASVAHYESLSQRISDLGRDSQMCQRQIGTINLRIKQVNQREDREYRATFQAIAKEMLDPDTYVAIMREMSFRQNYVLSDTPRTAPAGAVLPPIAAAPMRERK